MDKIIIQGLKVKSLIGVYDWERTEKQALLVDAQISLDLSAAAVNDDLTQTLDYAGLANELDVIAEQSQYQLLEALAGAMIAQLFKHAGVVEVVLTITKPEILPNADAVSVQLHRVAN